MNNIQGHNLIFLISQPRSGSTLTQRILGAHSQIHTQSEPWIMLHPLNALKSNNIHTAYDMDLYIKGARDFINHLPAKETSYRDIISEAYQSLYNSILDQNKKNLFLDKTPRYYYIIEELFDYFPNARFIFLWRNPAAVLTSIIQTWSKADWYRLSEWKDDLLLAPQLMLNGINQLKNKSFILKYEDLLSNPDIQIKKVCNFIGVPFDDKIINYGEFNMPDWQYGDQVTVNQKTRPDISHADTWLAHLHNPQIWRNVHDYMNYLGSELVSSMGYNFEEIENLLQENKPTTDIISHTLPLSDLINTNRSILIENKRLKNDLKNANEGLKNKDESLRVRNETIAQKEKSIQQSKMEVSKIQGILDEKKVVIEKQYSIISQKDNQIEHKTTELESLVKSLSEKDQVIEKRNNEITALELSLQEKESHIKQMLSDIGSLRFSLQEKESVVQQLEPLVASLELSLRNTESQVKDSDEKINAQKDEIERAKSAGTKLQSQLSALQHKLQTVEESKQHLNERIYNQQKQINELKEFIKSIERSYTFRIGTFVIWPARKLKNLLK